MARGIADAATVRVIGAADTTRLIGWIVTVRYVSYPHAHAGKTKAAETGPITACMAAICDCVAMRDADTGPSVALIASVAILVWVSCHADATGPMLADADAV